MKKETNIHPNEDLIIQWIVDETDVPGEIMDHFNLCEICGNKKRALEADLIQLTSFSKHLCPKPMHAISIDAEGRKPGQLFKPVLAICVLVLAVISALFLYTPEKRQQTAMIESKTAEQVHVATESIDYVDAPDLPESFITLMATPDEYFSDEFLEFVVPLENDDYSKITQQPDIIV